MASSIFAPLFPDEASHKKQYQISLDDNNPFIMQTLLELCHFERITPMHPPTLKDASLFSASSRRYGLVNMMAPWVMTWTSSLYDNDKLNFSKGDDLIAWLNICLTFGQEEMFRKITRRAIITATAESLDLAVPIEGPFKEIIETIARRRITVITELITVALALLARYQTAEGICSERGREGICHAMLMDSILEGPMSFGLYQPVPISPYPGMSAMDIIGEIKDLQLRTDPSHSGTCGREIKIETIEKLRIAIGILELVKGLDISRYDLQAEKAEEFLLQVVEDRAVQTYDKYPENGGDGEAENKENRGGRNEEPIQGPKEEVDEERNKDITFSDKDGDYEKDETSSELSTRINHDLDSLSETSDIQVPAGVIDGFSETKETIEDFGPQVFFRDGDARKKRHDIEKDGGGEQKQEGEDLKDNDSLTEDKDTTTLVYMQKVIPGHSNITMNNELTHVNETYTSQATNGIESAPNPELVENTSPKIAPLRHAVARANAEAHGQTWSTPGSELARKYQRGPRNPFPDGITVGDVSHEGHIANLKVLKSRFPTLDVKYLTTSLKQKNWDLQLATEFLSATEIAVTDKNDIDTHDRTVSVIDRLAMEPTSDIIHKEPGEYLGALEKIPTEAPATEEIPQLAIQESAPIFYEKSDQNSITSREAPLENSDIHQVPPPATLGPVLNIQPPIPRKAPLNDSTSIQSVVLRPATPESVFEKSTFIPQEKAPEGSIITENLLPPTVSVSDGSTSATQKAMSECSATKETLSPSTILNKVSISRLIAGKLSKEEAEKRFWPLEEDMEIREYLAISANRKTVKKLVHRFPESTADKGLIDVLYRSGWDLAKATSMLEGLGLVRRAISS
ncbi:uncharacterized protein LAJ45_05853 [Morchella importuna]|uniref:uncharacterized protein n=1 Tax=Morchella importuna TaxID=1174673 RepID=UPI001E8DA117|nr:uncharacterized protein LAJ45_05853 [Morchella importuna]KAH8150167.1 hypothetical protein LAJ45_05853 [Morchella importuna]